MTLRGSARPPGTLGVDLRRLDARLMRRTRHALTEHVGTPTAVQKALIERAVMLTVHLARLDSEALRTGIKDLEQYLSLSGALTRVVDKFGAKPPKPATADQSDTIAALLERLSA